MRRGKVTAEERIEVAKACAEGRISRAEAARRLRLHKSNVEEWVKRYEAGGALAFKEQEHNRVYPEEMKVAAVKEYLSGSKSQREISAKYGLRSNRQLRDWIKVYNSSGDFGHKMSGGSRMKQGRETAQEERIAIVKDCLENGSNFGETAMKHHVSYQQVYTWVKKFKQLGEDGLEDRRGKKTAAQEPRTEMEKMKVRMAQLEHELYMTRMERDLLACVSKMRPVQFQADFLAIQG